DVKFLTHHLGLDPEWWRWDRIHDTMTMAYLLDPLQSKALKSLSARYVSARATAGQENLERDMRKGGWNWSTVPINLPSYTFYSGLDTIITARLHDVLMPKVRAMFSDAYDLEQATTGVLFRMLTRGMDIDVEYCLAQREQMVIDAEQLKDEMERRWGISSPSANSQIAEALLADGVQLFERTDSGKHWKM